MSEPSEQQPLRRCGCWRKTALSLVILVPIAVWLYFGVQDARETARYCWCNNMFKQIGLAMHNYGSEHHRFPPAYLADDHDRPMHSWRVLLLPFMEEKEISRQYNLDEPWNSPHNSTLADRIVHQDPENPHAPPIYMCPSEWKAGMCDTSKVVFVGPHTAFNGSQPVRLKDFTDGLSNTALGSEMSESGIHWMEPRDLNFEEMSFKINDKNQIGLRSHHPRGVNISIADGSVRSVSNDIDPKVLKALITIDGGEDVREVTDR